LTGLSQTGPVTDIPHQPFWKTKPLEALDPGEWESLCDGCGRCCLVKLEDEDDGKLHYTDVSCRLFDAGSCKCKDYANRSAQVPDCVTLTPHEVRTLRWLPPTCGYRRVAEGKDLDWWHPLVSGNPATVVEAGISVRGCVSGNEDTMSVARMQKRIRDWPNSEKPSIPAKTALSSKRG
jgi:uncharacterized protein